MGTSHKNVVGHISGAFQIFIIIMLLSEIAQEDSILAPVPVFNHSILLAHMHWFVLFFKVRWLVTDECLYMYTYA